MATMETGVARSLGAGYGVEVRLDDRSGLGLAEDLRAALPPELVAGDQGGCVVTYRISAIAGEPPEYVVAADGLEVYAAASVEAVGDWLAADIDATVAHRCGEMTFVHAGVVGWRGLAIVIPGPRSAATSTLVAELVRRGAVYYSDRFAVLDTQGRVHSYRSPLEIGGVVQRDLRLVQEDVAVAALPVGLVVSCGGPPADAWRPEIRRGPRSALPLVGAVVGSRGDRLASVVAALEPTLVTLLGPWPEPVGAAAHLLDLIDEAYVNHTLHALTACSDGADGLTDDLVRAAETRLHAERARPLTPPRRLVATPYVRFSDFLPPTDRDRLLDHALGWEDEFVESGIIGTEGEKTLDYEARKSRTLPPARLEELWEMFDGPVRRILPYARRELGLDWFPLGKIERQLTAHGPAGFFVPHVDTGHPLVKSRRISCVYYFHPTPRRYRGGELRLYDTWETPTGTTGAASWTTVLPEDNSLVLFPSAAFHEVRPVHPASEAFADSRFAVTIWFHETESAEPASTAQLRS